MKLRYQIQKLGAVEDVMLQTISKLVEAELFTVLNGSSNIETQAKWYTQNDDPRKWVEVIVDVIPTKGEFVVHQMRPFMDSGCTISFNGVFTFRKLYFYSHGGVDNVS